MLRNLTTMPFCKSAMEWTAALRSWRRHCGRAREIGAILPDGCLLMKALEPVIQFLAKDDSQASFRLSQSRSQLQVDEKPDHVNLWQFSQCLLAEAETLSLFRASSKALSIIFNDKLSHQGQTIGWKRHCKACHQG